MLEFWHLLSFCSSLYSFQVGELVPKAPTVLKPSLKDEHLVKYILSPSASSACSVWVKRQHHDKLLGKRVSFYRHAWFFTSFLLRMFNTVSASVFKFLRHIFGFNFFHISRNTTGINLNKLRWHRTLIEMTYFSVKQVMFTINTEIKYAHFWGVWSFLSIIVSDWREASVQWAKTAHILNVWCKCTPTTTGIQ